MTPGNAKNIVLCSDGTGNSGGKGEGTNVWRLYGAVDTDGHRRPGSGIPAQLAFHEDGVGTEDFKLFKLIGGAFGWGLSRNICTLYGLLATNYVAGDSIYMFGFSRGAFTVRSLCGMVCRIGLIDVAHEFSEDEAREVLVDASAIRLLGWLKYRTLRANVGEYTQNELVKVALAAAFRRYRRRHLRERPLVPAPVRAALRWLSAKVLPGFEPYPDADAQTSDETRPAYFHKGVGVRCVGVWDTVGALGMPMDWMRKLLDLVVRINFHSTALHPRVEYAYQALAIDDERETFHPVLWHEGKSHPNTQIEQVWFAGAHSNVGGGYPKQGMANVSLYWMMRHAQRAGLCLYAEEVQRAQRVANVNDKLYDPRSGLGAYYRFMPRDIHGLTQRFGGDRPARIHASVFERVAGGVQDYAPANLPPVFEVVDDNGTCLHQPWTQLVQDHLTNDASLHTLHREAQRWTLVRRVHYYAMLSATLAIAGGAVMRYVLAARAAAARHAHAGASGSAHLASRWLIPDSTMALLRPTFSYLASHLDRLGLTLAVIVALLWLRGALRDRSERGFVTYWASLRNTLRARATSIRPPPPQQPQPPVSERGATSRV